MPAAVFLGDHVVLKVDAALEHFAQLPGHVALHLAQVSRMEQQLQRFLQDLRGGGRRGITGEARGVAVSSAAQQMRPLTSDLNRMTPNMDI